MSYDAVYCVFWRWRWNFNKPTHASFVNGCCVVRILVFGAPGVCAALECCSRRSGALLTLCIDTFLEFLLRRSQLCANSSSWFRSLRPLTAVTWICCLLSFHPLRWPRQSMMVCRKSRIGRVQTLILRVLWHHSAICNACLVFSAANGFSM